MKRKGSVSRKTHETDIQVAITLDGSGKADINTGIGFLDHMLTALSRHSGMDLKIKAGGDLHIDDHHTTEDVGICLGQALEKALGDKKGINRFGWALCPMDEALARVALDLSGRTTFIFDCEESSLYNLRGDSIFEFFKALSRECPMTLHMDVLRGQNTHHVLESLFKSLAKALQQAVKISGSEKTVPSTKGAL